MSTHGVLSRWVDFTVETSREPVSAFPSWAVLTLLYETFDATAEWDEVYEDGSVLRALLHPPPGWPPPGLGEHAAALLPEHPLVRWFGHTRGVTPMTLERVPTHVADARLVEAGRELMATADMRQQMVIPVPVSARSLSGFAISRGGRDFTLEHLMLAHQVQPLLMLMERQAKAAAAVDQGLTRAGLSTRETAVLGLLHRGLTTSAIAGRLGCSPRTIEKHLEHIYRKLGVRDRVTAIRAVDKYRESVPPIAAADPATIFDRLALSPPEGACLVREGRVPGDIFGYTSHRTDS